jgi:hypothetical protein
LRTGSSGARTRRLSTYAAVRAWTRATARSSNATVPTASTVLPRRPFSAVAMRTPRFCTRPGFTLTPVAAVSSSAYLGTSCMSMKGDLPGLSNFCPGTIGSYQ